MQAIRPSTHILYWIFLVYIFTGLLLSSASANNENYFLQTFSSDSYLVKELNEDIPADMICYQDEVNVERIPASVVFKRSSFSSNQPLSLLKKINEMQANSSRDIYFKQYLPLYFNGYSPG
jgi:hypothetical protein